MTEKISGGAFKQMVAFGAACITAQKQAINDLKPDGGTNLDDGCLLYTSPSPRD